MILFHAAWCSPFERTEGVKQLRIHFARQVMDKDAGGHDSASWVSGDGPIRRMRVVDASVRHRARDACVLARRGNHIAASRCLKIPAHRSCLL